MDCLQTVMLNVVKHLLQILRWRSVIDEVASSACERMTEERSVIDEVAPSVCERMTCSVNMYIITYEKYRQYKQTGIIGCVERTRSLASESGVPAFLKVWRCRSKWPSRPRKCPKSRMTLVKTAHPSAKTGKIADDPLRIRRVGGRINIFTFSVE